jgi:hypothetical protein
VFNSLRLAKEGHDVVQLPDPTPILPYLGLFTIVALKSQNFCIATLHLPPLFILENNHFVIAPDGTSPMDENVARIFDAAVITADSQNSAGWIPLSPEDTEFNEQRYWRLPVKFEAILAALFSRIANSPFGGCEEVRMAQTIFCMLRLQGLQLQDIGGGGPGHGGGSGRGGGPSGGQADSLLYQLLSRVWGVFA